MLRWKVKPSSLAILGGTVAVMLLIVALPNVDLPATAFHRGTAPVVVHSQATSAPVFAPVVTPIQLLHLARISSYAQDRSLTASGTPNFLPILLQSIRR